MFSLGTFGEGKNSISFDWLDSARKKRKVTFKAKTRTELAHILITFRRAQRRLRQKAISSDADLFEFIASKNPTCKIKSQKKIKGVLGTKIKEYKFNWRILGYVTIRQMQRLIKRKE